MQDQIPSLATWSPLMGIPTHLVSVDGNANDGGFVTDRLLGTSCTAVSDEQVHLENTIVHYVIGFTAR